MMPRTNPDPRVQANSSAAKASGTAPLGTASWRAFPAVLLLVCSLAAFYIWCAVRAYRAHQFAARRDQVSLQRAIQLQPYDASNYDLLGQYFMWKGQDPHAAASQFQQAATLNPYASAYWVHLAQAENSLGNGQGQMMAIRHALAVDPTTPEVVWDAANLFLVQGQTDEALDQLAVVVRNDPNMAEVALDTGWRALGAVDPILRRLPPDPAIYLKFVRVLVARQQWRAADQVWSSMLQLNREFDPRAALFYVDGLLAQRNVAGAQKVWQQLQENSASLRPYVTPGNLIVNTSFEHDFLNAGFDWHYTSLPGIAVMLDSTQAYRGSESLLITFSGNADDAGVWQYVPVTPGTSYMASAWVRSEELESADGPRLVIYDAHKNTELGHSEETLGTTSWHRVEATFSAERDTALVVVRFSRNPGDTRVRGQFWVDDVRLSQRGNGGSVQ
jgi:tetratricopeptide (TPR) repeat protein